MSENEQHQGAEVVCFHCKTVVDPQCKCGRTVQSMLWVQTIDEARRENPASPLLEAMRRHPSSLHPIQGQQATFVVIDESGDV